MWLEYRRTANRLSNLTLMCGQNVDRLEMEMSQVREDKQITCQYG